MSDFNFSDSLAFNVVLAPLCEVFALQSYYEGDLPLNDEELGIVDGLARYEIPLIVRRQAFLNSITASGQLSHLSGMSAEAFGFEPMESGLVHYSLRFVASWIYGCSISEGEVRAIHSDIKTYGSVRSHMKTSRGHLVKTVIQESEVFSSFDTRSEAV